MQHDQQSQQPPNVKLLNAKERTKKYVTAFISHFCWLTTIQPSYHTKPTCCIKISVKYRLILCCPFRFGVGSCVFFCLKSQLLRISEARESIKLLNYITYELCACVTRLKNNIGCHRAFVVYNI